MLAFRQTYLRYLLLLFVCVLSACSASRAEHSTTPSAQHVNLPIAVAPGTPALARSIVIPSSTSTPAPTLTPAPTIVSEASPALSPTAVTQPVPSPTTVTQPAPSPTALPVYSYTVVNVYPHDPQAFTQGLVYHEGVLYEGTGLRGRSTLRRVELATGTVLQEYALEPHYFGEGITLFGDTLIQLTWQSHIGFVYDRASFTRLRDFSYPTEGWGLTHDGTRLIMSDGTATLFFLDPVTLENSGQVSVTDGRTPVTRLNELEYINGEVLANIWQTDRVARIDPLTGQVLGWIDLSGLLSEADRQQADVLNGIAYDADEERLFVTGKLWPELFEIELVLPLAETADRGHQQWSAQ